jgi:hypothetical protein
MYSLRLVRFVLDRIHDDSSNDAKLDVMQALARLPPHFRAALLLRAEGYTDAEIGKRVLGDDCWGSIEGMFLLVFAERELMNEIRGKR